MTGELTLTGLVLPVGGIREKVLAAKRAGVEELILPKRNEADVLEIPADYRKDLVFHFAERIDDVWAVALLPVDACSETEPQAESAAPPDQGANAPKRPRKKAAAKPRAGRGGSATPPG